MSHGKILHLFGWDKKFFLPFREFIHEHFVDGRHNFIVYGDVKNDDVPASSDTKVIPSILKNIIGISKAMNKADKIIIHGLFNNHLFYLLAIQPWLLKKCYWFIWGGDLYIHNSPVKNWRWKKNEFFRKIVIKNIGFIVTGNRGDYNFAKEKYQIKGKMLDCFSYPNNIYKEVKKTKEYSGALNIIIGNSADPTNNHLDILEMLKEYKTEDIMIYAPLSYGDKVYAEIVAKKGKEIFGSKFYPIFQFIKLENYLDFLNTIDIAIFNHNRQQAFGNIVTLLGYGKKVYIRKTTSLWEYFVEKNIKVNDVNNFDLTLLSLDDRNKNVEIIKSYFSTENLRIQLTRVFNC